MSMLLTDQEIKILKLRRDGYRNYTIAKKLKISNSTVGNIAHKLIQAGILAPLPRGPVSPTKRQHKIWEQKIIKLRDKGYQNDQIINKIKMPKRHFIKLRSKLIKTNQIASGRGLDRARDNERTLTIIAMRKEHKTLSEIGAVFKITRERVRQIINNIINKYGNDIIKGETYTTTQAAEYLDIRPHKLSALCKQGKITARRRNNSICSGYIITKAELERIKTHLDIINRHICIHCGNAFQREKHGSMKTCSKHCQTEHLKQQFIKYRQPRKTPDALKGWRKALWYKVKSHIIPSDEKWITINRASQLTGLSTMQLYLLQWHQILTTRPHPTKIWRGKPVMTYAISQLQMIKQVYPK